jgi:hypothetical protein
MLFMANDNAVQVQRSFGEHTTGTLYLVPTPIGNLSDFSPRAVDILRGVDLIAAEDTRNTQKLLTHFTIDTRQISFHEHNTQARIPVLLARLQQGESIAQVSDAGMPAISDPGQELVAACVAADIPVGGAAWTQCRDDRADCLRISYPALCLHWFFAAEESGAEEVFDRIRPVADDNDLL